jgi:anaerobic selenocysteine-containing dehydrogenase
MLKKMPAAAGTKILKSVCRSCHGGCGVLLHVQDGVLAKVEGDPDSPLNRGRLCPIGTVTADIVNHPDRLKYPMRRLGARGSGQWQRISWDEALDEIAEKLLAIRDKFGPEAVALGTGTGRHHIRWVSRFGHAFGTPNWCELRAALDARLRRAGEPCTAVHAGMGGADYVDFRRAHPRRGAHLCAGEAGNA